MSQWQAPLLVLGSVAVTECLVVPSTLHVSSNSHNLPRQ